MILRQVFLFLLILGILIVIETQPLDAASHTTDSLRECRQKIAAYLLRVRSPMAAHAQTFANAAARNDLDCYLLPAISGVESSFGKAAPHGSYNPFGWHNGRYGFKNWSQAIDVVSDNLGTRYVKRWGAKTPEEIGRYYATDPKWPKKVRSFMVKIQSFPLD